MFLFQFLFPSFSEHFRNIGISVASLSLPRIATPATPNLWARISSAVLTISSPKILAKLASVVATGGRFQAITRNEILLFLRQKAFRDCFFLPGAWPTSGIFVVACLFDFCVCVRVSVHSMALTIYIYMYIYINYIKLFIIICLFSLKMVCWVLTSDSFVMVVSSCFHQRMPNFDLFGSCLAALQFWTYQDILLVDTPPKS